MKHSFWFYHFRKPKIFNFHIFEKLKTFYITKLIISFLFHILCKKTDSITNKIKGKTWEDITNDYNALQITGIRTTVQLKAVFDIMKRNTKKAQSSEKVKNILLKLYSYSKGCTYYS